MRSLEWPNHGRNFQFQHTWEQALVRAKVYGNTNPQVRSLRDKWLGQYFNHLGVDQTYLF
jgi:hypothetical protein